MLPAQLENEKDRPMTREEVTAMWNRIYLREARDKADRLERERDEWMKLGLGYARAYFRLTLGKEA